MRPLKLALLALALLPIASGCVIAIDADEWDDDHRWTSGWEVRQHRNLDFINSLALGESIETVLSYLGDPDFTESFNREGERFEVLFYRTHRMHGDGATSKDETTPVVFVDGELVGWGDSAVDKATLR